MKKLALLCVLLVLPLSLAQEVEPNYNVQVFLENKDIYPGGSEIIPGFVYVMGTGNCDSTSFLTLSTDSYAIISVVYEETHEVIFCTLEEFKSTKKCDSNSFKNVTVDEESPITLFYLDDDELSKHEPTLVEMQFNLNVSEESIGEDHYVEGVLYCGVDEKYKIFKDKSEFHVKTYEEEHHKANITIAIIGVVGGVFGGVIVVILNRRLFGGKKKKK